MKKTLYLFFLTVFTFGFSCQVNAQYYITTLAGNGTAGLLGDGAAATAAELNNPHSVFKDASGNIFICDDYNNAIRKISTTGIITRIAGTGSTGYTGDGSPATAATLNEPFSVIVDAAGNVYFSDASNNVVRMINTSGIISTIAGNGIAGYLGDGHPASSCELNTPAGLSFDGAGNLYIGDINNNRVRVINTSGIISTFAGNGTGGFSSDGIAATASELYRPNYVHATSSGDLYITDNGNHRIRLVSGATGIITTVVGNGTPGGSGVGVPATAAELDYPGGVNFDAAGNMYIAGDVTENIRVVNTSGIINNYAGNGIAGFIDNVAATASELHTPVDVAFDANGNMVIADQQNNRIRIVKRDAIPKFTNGESQTMTVCENTYDTLNSYLPIQDSDVGQTETWTLLSVPPHGSINAGFGAVTAGGVLYTTASTGGIVTLPIPTIEIFYQTTTGYTGLDSFSVVISDSITTDTTKIVVTVNPPPTAITGNFNVCQGGAEILTDAVTGGIWTSGNTAVATVGSGTGRVGGITVGGTATITYTTSCGVATGNVAVNIAPSPFTGSLTVCAGGTGVLTDAATGGLWSSNATSLATINSSTGEVYGLIPGSAGMQYVVGVGVASCGIGENITIISGVGAISPTSPSVCAGSTIQLTDASGTGAWSSSATGVATVTSGGVVTGVATGTATIEYSNGSCSASIIVTVTSAPSPITGNLIACAGAGAPPDTLSDATGGIWSSSNVIVAAINGSSGVLTGEAAGTATITDSVGPGCSVTVIVTVNPNPPAPTGIFSVCVGQPFTLSDATSGGTWSSNSTAIATVTNSGGSVTGVNSGSTTITYTVGGCYATGTFSFIASSPISPLSTSVCAGGTETLTESTLTSPYTGAWSSSNTSLATVSSSGTVYAESLGTDTISYQIYNGGAPACAPYTATVNVTSGAGSITPSTAISFCSGTTTALTDATSGGVWSSDNTGVATVSTSGVVGGVAAGTATIMYSLGSCTTTKVITVTAGPAALSPSSATLCAGTTASLTETTTGGTWSSSATGIATVSGGTVGGVGAGTATIAYTTGSCSATAIVTVAATPDAIGPSTAVVLCSSSTTTLTESVSGGTWSSNATGTATVSTAGVVKGVAAGTAIISYTSGSCYVTKTVTVSAGPAAISPASPTVCTGTTSSLTETVTGGTWSSSVTGTATVSSTGIVGGIVPGTSTIAYSLGSCSASAVVTVANSPAAITPSTAVVFCSATTTTLAESVTGGAWSSGATGTATVSSAGIVTGVTGGTATISYSSGTCYVTKTVTVSPGPAALLPASPIVCTGSTLSITDAVSGGTWGSSATGTATVSGTGVVGGVAPGSVNITYSIGSCTATDAVTVILTPTVSAVTGTTSLCTGATTALTEAATDGLWSSSNTAAATVSATGIVYGAGVGTPTISYTITSSCGVIGAALLMTVNTSPSAGTIAGAATMCAGTTMQLSNTVTGGSWSSSNSSASVNSASGLVSAISPGSTDTITYTITTPCGTASATKVITIGAYLSAGTIGGAAILCGGATVHLTDASTGGSWSSSNSSATVGSTGIVTGAATGGMDTISYTVTASCGSAVATDIIDVYPTAIAGTMSGVSILCTGSSVTFTETAASGVWSSQNSNATVTGGGLVTAVSAGTDIISYSVSNSCGTSVATVNVTISSAAPTAGTITGAGSVCAGTPVALTDAVSGGVWSSSNTNASVSSTGMVTALASGLDTISYTLSTSCGTAIATFVISANGTVPTAGTITGASGVCVGYPIAFTSTVSGGTWSISNSHATITTAGLVSGVTTGTDTVGYTVSTSCGTAATTVAVTVGTTTGGAGSISGTATTCTGSTTVLTDGTAGGAWSSSNTNATVIGGTVTGVTAGAATISYSVTYSCGIAYATDDITINPSTPISAISGPVAVCVGSTVTFTDATAGGAWSSSNSNVSLSGGEVTGVALGTSTVSYTVTSVCGTGSALSVVTIVPASTVTLAPISGISIVCVGSGITLTDATPGGIWLSSNAHAAVVGFGIIDGVSPGIDTIGYLVTGVCGNVEVTKILSVDTLPIVAPITGTPSQCVGSTLALSDPMAGGIWTESNPAVGTVGLSTGVVTGLSAGTTIISYTVTNLYGCPNTVTLEDAVTPSSVTTPITGSAGVCLGSATTLSNATAGGAWSSSNTAVAVIDLLTGSVTGLMPGTTTIGYTVSGSCGIATITSTETVEIFPTVSAIIGSPTVCAGAATVLADATLGGLWSSRNTAIAAANATSGAVTGVSGGTDEIYYLVANSCGSVMDSASIVVYPGPAVDAITAAYTAVCTDNTLDISDGTAGGVWVSSNTAIATVSRTGAILGRMAGEDTIYYVVTNSRGCSSAAMVSITIGGAIAAGTVDPTGAVELCQGHSVYMDVSPSAGFGYQWLRNGTAIAGATLPGYTTSTTGNYSVILSNGICSETVTGPSVITPALPVISFTPPDKLSTGAYATYQWFRNGVLIAGATESSTDETGGGVYTVVVTDAQGCTDTSTGYTAGATGINNVNTPGDIKVYPNPATSVVYIAAAVAVNVSVVGIDGKLLIQQNNTTDVDISALADGMYMILVYDQSGLLLKTAKVAKVE